MRRGIFPCSDAALSHVHCLLLSTLDTAVQLSLHTQERLPLGFFAGQSPLVLHDRRSLFPQLAEGLGQQLPVALDRLQRSHDATRAIKRQPVQ